MKINAVIEDKISHTEKIFSQNNCESNVLNIYSISSLGFKELILRRASSYSKIFEKTLRAWCGIDLEFQPFLAVWPKKNIFDVFFWKNSCEKFNFCSIIKSKIPKCLE